MLKGMRNVRLRAVVLGAYALIMACIGLLHHVPSAAAAPSANELASYLLPDGSVPALCGEESGGDPQPQGHAAHPICDACLLAGSPGLIVGAIALPTPTYQGIVQFTVGTCVRLAATNVLRAPPRGPPSVSNPTV